MRSPERVEGVRSRERAMRFTYRLVIAILAVTTLSAAAPAKDLRLIPQPKQIKQRDRFFNVTGKTRIVIHTAHTDNDRTAAEMLADEIDTATGVKLRITISLSTPGASGDIYHV